MFGRKRKSKDTLLSRMANADTDNMSGAEYRRWLSNNMDLDDLIADENAEEMVKQLLLSRFCKR